MSVSSTIQVNVPSINASFDIGANSVFCSKWNEVFFQDASEILTPTRVNYKWDFGDGKSSTAKDPKHTYTGIQDYNAKLTVTDGNGCSTSMIKKITIKSSPIKPVISFQTGVNRFCAGDSAVLTTLVNQPDPNPAFTWYRDNSFIANGKTVIAKESGLYSLVVLNSLNECSDTSSVLIVAYSLPEKPTVSIAPGSNSTICSADSTTIMTSVLGVDYNYLWYRNDVPSPVLVETGITPEYKVFPFTKTSTTVIQESYFVQIVDQNNCSSLPSDVFTITIDPSPIVSLTPKTNPTICEGQSVQLDALINPATTNFSWSRNFEIISATTTTITASISGIYRIKATSLSNGCSRTSNPVTVTVNPFPPIPDVSLDPNISFFGLDGTINICQGSLAKFSIAPIDNASYQWFRNGAAISNAKTILYNATSSGTYRIDVTVLNCTSRSTEQKVFVLASAPGTLLSPPRNLICNGSSQTISATGSLGYQWYYNGNAIEGASSATYDADSAGVYKVEFIDINGCKRLSSNFINLSLIQKPKSMFSYELHKYTNKLYESI